MGTPGWLTRDSDEVPAGTDWLSPVERTTLAGLALPARRADWLLGRFTAKTLVGAWVGVRPEQVEIVAAADGAPEAWIDGVPAPVTVSLSHRAGRGFAAVSNTGAVGCDLELVEPRSTAFVSDWLGPAERDLVAASAPEDCPRLVNLLWSAKEAAAKVRRAGLRLDVRAAQVELGEASRGWRPLRVVWSDGAATTSGWWRSDHGWVLTLLAQPAPAAPRLLDPWRATPPP